MEDESMVAEDKILIEKRTILLTARNVIRFMNNSPEFAEKFFRLLNAQKVQYQDD